ncbi:MAG: Rid family detoxifying hydrolase [Actinomycetota bacterium]|nr:Rid family detoxifying hydrolase [Actinomycetota bacterium]
MAGDGGGALLSPVSTEGAPAAIGPYVQGMSVAGGCRLVFTSGQLPLDPASGTLVDGGIREEARQALRNALGILAAAGARAGDVVRSTVYLLDMATYPQVNEVYEQVFAGHLPARTVVGVSALPRGASLEVELVAAVEG